jgi:hypothetical protein
MLMAAAGALACPCAWCAPDFASEGAALPLGFSRAAALPLMGAGAETLGNGLAIARGAAIESNGMVNASPAALLGMLAVKAAMVKYADGLPPERRASSLKANAGFFGGFGASNLLIAAGATTGVAAIAGLFAGWWSYGSEGEALDREAAARKATPEQARRVASLEESAQGVSASAVAAALSVKELMARAERKAIEDMGKAGKTAQTMLVFETSWDLD